MNSKPFVIEKITAFVSDAPDGDEGIIGFKSGNSILPMIGADQTRVREYYLMAKEISVLYGRPFKVIQFTQRTDITQELKTLYDG